ncbi:MAG: TonB-dependent receptor [Candidatus Eremiobacteraeota bacterium]|nr:TonB-dependent receptor [Candidatus Eremiobacteraeota bacterium]
MSSVLSATTSAATAGQIIGTVIDAKTKKPIAGARISAASPSERYATTSNEKGDFAIAGVTLDTYTIAIEARGYSASSISGATVTGDEAFRVAFVLTPSTELRTLANVSARSAGSPFQPGHTADTITVTAAQIDQILGKSLDTDQTKLLERLPSVTIDKNDVPLIRGGFAFQTGYDYEGIDFTQPSAGLSNRFSNFANGSILLGAASLQITPGGGDATRGNTGTGNIDLTAKRGTYPATGLIDFEAGAVGGGTQFGVEYGYATPNNRFSNYATFVAENTQYQYGPYGTLATSIGADPTIIDPSLQSFYTADQRRLYQTAIFNPSIQAARTFLDNLVLRFGHQNGQSLQFFIQSQIVHEDLDYGGLGLFSAVPQTIFFANNPLVNPGDIFGASSSPLSLDYLLAAPNGLSQSAYAKFITQFTPAAAGAEPGLPLKSPEAIYNSFDTFKIEYQNNFDGNKSAAVRFYRALTDQSEALPSQGLDVPQNGGIRTGGAVDFTDILSTRNTLQIGGKFEYAIPFGSREDSIDYTGAYAGLYRSVGGSGYANLGADTHDLLADFVDPVLTVTGSAGNPYCIGAKTPSGAPYLPPAGGIPQEHCGYLYKYFPNGPPGLPPEIEIPTAQQKIYGLYAQDTYAPNSRLRISTGLRLDGYNFLIPDDPQNPPAVDGLRHQRLYEPKLAASYRLTPHDYVRANFGSTLSIPPATFIGTNIDRSAFSAYANVPSYDSVTGKAATYCGPGQTKSIAGVTYFVGDRTCTSYADQMYWLMRNARFQFQDQLTSPLRGATFTNYDFSFSHEFPDRTAVSLTPFYRVGYDIVEPTQTLLGIDPLTGTQQLSPVIESNLGLQRATGLEFSAATRPVAFGFSAQLSATYINQIGNDSTTPYLPTASVQLGELYRSPDLSPFQSTLAFTYKTKWGFRVNPVLTYKHGYPYGAGTLNAFTVNGQNYYAPYSDALYYGIYSSLLSTCAVNPQNPGTVGNPNCYATKGVDAISAGPGTLFAKATLNTDITFELSPPNNKRGLKYGLAITNVFNQTAGIPVPNYTQYCQLVSTGLCAQSGPSVIDKTHGPQVTYGGTSGPYVSYPNLQPIQARFYVQESF